ncbi:MAG: serpin family protein [Brevefilum sp.]|nr:serpin family protein [Brevefilum sp.]
MKYVIIILTGLTLLVASACQGIEDIIPSNEGDQMKGFLSSDIERELAPDVGPSRLQSLASDNTAFALAFYDLIRSEEGNLVYSPFSLSLALSMTLAGAETTTRDAMLDALQFSLEEGEIHPTLNALMLAIEASQAIDEGSEGGSFELSIANSIWGQQGFNFKQAFLDRIALNYGAGIYTVNFAASPELARVAINDWVEDETQEKIKDLIPPDTITQLTRLVLANAIYFKGSWFHPFDQGLTQPGPFTTLGGDEIRVDMMKLFDEHLLYLQEGELQVISLPYLSRDFVMTLIVPDHGSFTTVEDRLTVELLETLMNKMVSERINLEMPKFDFETTINANDALKTLEMAEAFDPDLSDFKGMADVEDLHISDVLQKATITVDEEGTEAAAATAVIVGIKSAPIGEPISLVIDRPFLFFIQHQPTGTILFMGRVVQP